ncbi:hypothetical protein [Dyella caseinilytica]|uniref:Zn-dependent protease DUF2268 n=1 Tax=Dyella caseinilytica TaxID=1849581 RepID=A0ABX7GSA6_9GAMM|nr:hypothetical protein [Dyella caseinilytica]QRN53329.1 hypothetical protein ISN74_18170 [Dyella caseinilytica]GGA13274.1 hypothetical protein GCM10011408_38580 [Dyella caseinilytica]
MSTPRVVTALLLLAAALPAWGANQTPSMASSFAAFWSVAQGRPLTEQLQQWDRYIEAPRRDVYASVVWDTQHHSDWALRKQRYLQARFADYPSLAAGIPSEAASLQQALEQTIPRFGRLFSDASARPLVYEVLAPNFDAKSGVLADGTPVLAFAVDSLLLEKASLDIVVPHELFHLYHAQHAGFSNDGVMSDVPLTIPLFEEGLATYVSSQLSSGHGDGDLLLQSDLGDIPASRLPEIARRFLVDARFKAIDSQHPGAFKRWFNASATAYQRDLPNRTGYWVGLQLIRYLRKSYSLASIASWTPQQADSEVMLALHQLSATAEVSSPR